MSGKIMKKSLRNSWVKALRSGKFKQTTACLERISTVTGKTVGNCCLGVLCHVAGVTRQKPKKDWGEYNNEIMFGRGNNASTGMIPSPTAYKLGLTDKMMEVLAHMNDSGKQKNGKRHTFKSIADFIEVRLKAA